ncbi:TRAP transporter large permease [Phreatobacter sp.]|uniref:TRAP transporter large permease n=1 Tax=Phreatobacter sp. TaxID=1966341 RepID=UPI003F718ED3
MAPIMFVVLVAFLILGYPVAFALAANGLFFAIIGIQLDLFVPNFLQALPERIFGTMNNETLLAIPFFTFMGMILERSGMAEDLLDTIGQLFGTVRGGLAYAVIFVGALLAATTGVVAASVISMGLISLPIMLRYGYDRRLASGAIVASGTLAQIIPPSIVLIVMADQLGRSVGDMYQGAFLPGLILTLMYATWVFIVSLINPKAVPGLPAADVGFREPDGARGVGQLGILTLFSGLVAYHVMSQTGVAGAADFVVLTLSVTVMVAFLCALLNRWFGARYWYVTFIATIVFGFGWYYLRDSAQPVLAVSSEAIAFGSLYALVAGLLERFGDRRLISNIAEQVTFVMVPPLALIFLVLGTIFIGVATPTEGGAMGAVGALMLAGVKRYLTGEQRRFNFSIVRQAVESTAKLSAFVLFILVGARVFGLTFYGVNGHVWVEHLLTSLPGGVMGFLIVVNLVVFILGFFLDFFELAFIIVPLMGPAAEKLGIDLIWFGVILSVNMQTSFLTPPFGFALFYLRSVAPKVPYIDKVTGKTMEPITTIQIYRGSVPFVAIQCVMVALVISFPQLVLHYKPTGPQVDPASIDIRIDLPGLGGGLPGLDAPGGGLPGLGAPPGLGGPPPGLGGPPPGLGGPPPGLEPPPAPRN